MCYDPACLTQVKLKDGSTATRLNVQRSCRSSSPNSERNESVRRRPGPVWRGLPKRRRRPTSARGSAPPMGAASRPFPALPGPAGPMPGPMPPRPPGATTAAAAAAASNNGNRSSSINVNSHGLKPSNNAGKTVTGIPTAGMGVGVRPRPSPPTLSGRGGWMDSGQQEGEEDDDKED